MGFGRDCRSDLQAADQSNHENLFLSLSHPYAVRVAVIARTFSGADTLERRFHYTSSSCCFTFAFSVVS